MNINDWYQFSIFFDPRQMAKNAVKWATSKNLCRVNEIHGKPEYRVPLNFEFRHRDLERATMTVASETVLEDTDVQYLLPVSLGAQLFWGFLWERTAKQFWLDQMLLRLCLLMRPYRALAI